MVVLRQLQLLPGAIFALVILTFIVTYIISVFNEHVKPGFPYISDTGTKPPESCIFAQFINMAAVLLLFCVYVRFRQVAMVAHAAGEGLPDLVAVPRWANRTSAFFGSLSCLGLDMVANFQEENVLAAHMVGAFMCFFSATIYFCLQTYFSRKLMPSFTSPCAFVSRIILSALCIVLCITTIVPGGIAVLNFDGEDKMKWMKGDGGWEMHLVSTVSEWLLVLCFCSFIASFSSEFKGITIHEPQIEVEGCQSVLEASYANKARGREVV